MTTVFPETAQRHKRNLLCRVAVVQSCLLGGSVPEKQGDGPNNVPRETSGARRRRAKFLRYRRMREGETVTTHRLPMIATFCGLYEEKPRALTDSMYADESAGTRVASQTVRLRAVGGGMRESRVPSSGCGGSEGDSDCGVAGGRVKRGAAGGGKCQLCRAESANEPFSLVRWD